MSERVTATYQRRRRRIRRAATHAAPRSVVLELVLPEAAEADALRAGHTADAAAAARRRRPCRRWCGTPARSARRVSPSS
jgi:hypothetical protein